jgi:hypothetical protein
LKKDGAVLKSKESLGPKIWQGEKDHGNGTYTAWYVATVASTDRYSLQLNVRGKEKVFVPTIVTTPNVASSLDTAGQPASSIEKAVNGLAAGTRTSFAVNLLDAYRNRVTTSLSKTDVVISSSVDHSGAKRTEAYTCEPHFSKTGTVITYKSRRAGKFSIAVNMATSDNLERNVTWTLAAAPVMVSSRVAGDGRAIKINFDQPTDRASFNGVFTCSALIAANFSQSLGTNARCKWSADRKTLYLMLESDESVQLYSVVSMQAGKVGRFNLESDTTTNTQATRLLIKLN